MKDLRKWTKAFLCVFISFMTMFGAACGKTPPPDPDGNGNGDGSGEEEVVVDPPDESISQAVVNDTIRIQFLSETLVRIERKGPKGFEDRESYIVTGRKGWKQVPYTKAESGGNIILSASEYAVVVPENATTVSDVVIRDKSGEVLWTDNGLTTTNMYLPSPSDALQSWYFTDSPRVIPHEKGYSSFSGLSPYLQGWDFANNAPDYFVFLSGGSYKQFCQDYTDLTGKSEMVSLQMLGFWDSRWYAYSSETALQQIRDYRDRGYPIDMLVIDTDWREPSGGGIGYDINTSLFPDMAKFLQEAHDLGVGITFNDHPEPAPATSNGLDGREVNYRNEKLTLILSLGMDYWWYDRNWHVSLNSFSPDISAYAFGMYAFQWITDSYYQTIADDLYGYAKRALIMGNVDGLLHGKWTYASDVSAHRYSIQWSGDIGADSRALEQEIFAAVFGGAEVGLPYVSSDIGGHTAAVTDEMYARWIQYGALSPITRVHTTKSDYIGQEGRMPWLFGDQAEAVTKEYIEMRYRLLPLYYQLARENYDTGLPIMRRTDIEYPQYAEASRNDQYLLGDSILVAPIAASENNDIVPASWLSHTDGGAEKPGLSGRYYNNANWTGNFTAGIDGNIDFDWGTDGPISAGADNFSIVWTGQVKIGSKDAALQFYADDAIQVRVNGRIEVDGLNVYDTLLNTPVYAAGSVLDIEVRYAEYGGNAHVFMYYKEDGNSEVARTVFIPDGTWIDVWSGEPFVGPRTITAKHNLSTSPIFVREGSVIALAENMSHTGEKDWSKMSLDVYPSAAQKAKTTIYEDDTATQAYKDGKYRTTDIESAFDSKINAQVVTVNPAEGGFDGPKAFSARTYTVRVHARGAFGAVNKITVNGANQSFAFHGQDGTASPFAFSGGARDGDIYEFSFTADVSGKYEISVIFSSVDTVKDAEPEYDRSSLAFDLSAGVSDRELNISEAGNYDWALFGVGYASGNVRKENGGSLIGVPASYDRHRLFTNNLMSVSWTDGDTEQTGFDMPGVRSQKDFGLTLRSVGNREYFVIYAGGYKCTAKVTVRDRAGNVKTVYFGDLNGYFIKRIVIKCNEAKAAELKVAYAVVSCVADGLNSPSEVYLIGAYVSDVLKDPVLTGAETKADVTYRDSVSNLSAANLNVPQGITGVDNIDWRHFGQFGGGVQSVSKAGGSAISKAAFDEWIDFDDYPTVISWSGGDEIPIQGGTRLGTCTPGEINITLALPAGTNYIQIYTGAWRSKNTVYISGIWGDALASSPPFAAGEQSQARLVTFKTESGEASRILIKIVSTDALPGGNVSLAAISVFAESGGAGS
ncbi:MAG: DUF5110 domain-containing protein [Clostridiales bacterium]|nr:DUF5110 domain-containing protein [Clostridiales bacterium]